MTEERLEEIKEYLKPEFKDYEYDWKQMTKELVEEVNRLSELMHLKDCDDEPI